MKKLTCALSLTLLCSIPGIIFFVALFWLGIGSSLISILMYRGLVLAGVAGIAHLFFLAPILGRRVGVEFVIIAAVSLAFAANVFFLVVFPVTIDRSVSVYLLGQLSQHPGGLSEEQLSQRMINQYVVEYRAVDRRMREQIVTGNIKAEGDLYLLTDQGQNFIRFSRVVSYIFGLDPRVVQLPESGGDGI
jgi:hypothetical protein